MNVAHDTLYKSWQLYISQRSFNEMLYERTNFRKTASKYLFIS